MITQVDVLRIGDVYTLLRNRIKEAGSQKAFAAQCGVSETYISDVMNARRDPGPQVLGTLGLRRIVCYTRIADCS